MSQYTKNRQSALNLVELHAMCEANYARLLSLFPDYETANSREFLVGEGRIHLEVTSRARYTTEFRLQQSNGGERWLGSLRVEVRAYHDATMLEVSAFQSHRCIQARYQYPNRQMFQQNEKIQQNRFLAEWLEHCLQRGRSATEISLRA